MKYGILLNLTQFFGPNYFKKHNRSLKFKELIQNNEK